MDTHYHVTLQMVFANLQPKLLSPLYGLALISCLIFILQEFIGGMTKIDERYWIETDSFIHSSLPKKIDSTSGIKGNFFSICSFSTHAKPT